MGSSRTRTPVRTSATVYARAPLPDEVTTNMDPNAALKRITELSEDIIQGDNTLDYESLRQRAEELAETVIGLDEWISKGGFLPTAWRK